MMDRQEYFEKRQRMEVLRTEENAREDARQRIAVQAQGEGRALTPDEQGHLQELDDQSRACGVEVNSLSQECQDAEGQNPSWEDEYEDLQEAQQVPTRQHQGFPWRLLCILAGIGVILIGGWYVVNTLFFAPPPPPARRVAVPAPPAPVQVPLERRLKGLEEWRKTEDSFTGGLERRIITLESRPAAKAKMDPQVAKLPTDMKALEERMDQRLNMLAAELNKLQQSPGRVATAPPAPTSKPTPVVPAVSMSAPAAPTPVPTAPPPAPQPAVAAPAAPPATAAPTAIAQPQPTLPPAPPRTARFRVEMRQGSGTGLHVPAGATFHVYLYEDGKLQKSFPLATEQRVDEQGRPFVATQPQDVPFGNPNFVIDVVGPKGYSYLSHSTLTAHGGQLRERGTAVFTFVVR